jgi:hypothetical protein
VLQDLDSKVFINIADNYCNKRNKIIHMKRRINKQLDADKLRFTDVISSKYFGNHYAHHQETELNQQTAYDVQH